MKRHSLGTPGHIWRPSELLAFAEDYAEKIRKLLRACATHEDHSGTSVSTDDALAIAELIAIMARSGRRQRAADAMVIAEKVEMLIDQLGTEIDEILASGN